jgi:hypothetical protein
MPSTAPHNLSLDNHRIERNTCIVRDEIAAGINLVF